MSEDVRSDTRGRLLHAAADLIASSPGEDFSLRAVCDLVGVGMPTLYHFFGSKQGLVDAVVDHGFDLFMEHRDEYETTGDPIQDIRISWDAHVAFGLANQGFYTLMYGKVRPGHSPPSQDRPSATLRSLTQAAAAQGRLAVPPRQAAAHLLVTNIGVTLRQIVLAQADRALSDAVREGAIAAVTGTAGHSTESGSLRTELHAVLELAAARPHILGDTETQLFTEWVRRLEAGY